MRLHQRFPHEGVVFRVAVLNQRPLHGFFVGIGGDVDTLHGAGVKAGAVHDGGQRGGGGVKVLHLLRIVAHVPDVLGQLYGLLECRAKLGKNEHVSTQVLEKVCKVLHCEIQDIMEFVPDEEREEK